MAGLGIGSPCCCSPACSGSIRFTVRGCGGDSFFNPSATFAGPGSSSGTAVRTTGPPAVSFVVGSLPGGAGTYTITITAPGYYSRTITATGTCGSNNTLPDIYLRPTSLTFSGSTLCGGLNGTTITLGGVYSGSCTLSDASPSCTISVADIAGTTAEGNFTATIAQARYVSVTNTYSWSTGTWTCNNALALTTLADCYVCCNGCKYPISNVLLLTTPMGSAIVPYTLNTVGFAIAANSHPTSIGPFPTLVCGCSVTESSHTVTFRVRTACNSAGLGSGPWPPTGDIFYTACPDNQPYQDGPADICGSAGTGSVTGVPGRFEGIASIDWTGSCHPYSWSGTYDPGIDTTTGLPYAGVPELVGTYTLTEAGCGSVIGPIDPLAPLLGMPGDDLAADSGPDPDFEAMLADLEAAVPVQPPKPPGLVEMAGNFAKAVASHVAGGFEVASPEVQAEREAECASNRCGKHDPAKDACNSCGCGKNPALSMIGVDLRLKRSWATSGCPEGKWGPVT